MKAVFSVLLLVELAFSAPTDDFNPIFIGEAFFADSNKIYESNHDIVKIYAPLNNINFDKNSKGSVRESGGDGIIFFIEADNNQGNQSLYIRLNGKTKKLLDEARDIAAPYDDSKEVYFAAKDGLYIYDYEQNEAKKFGTINEDLIGIVCGKTNKTLFVLTAEKKVYKVSEEGTNLELIDGIKNAQHIVLDYADNLFYDDDNGVLYVMNEDGILILVDLPNYPLTLIRPPFVLEKGIIVVVKEVVFVMYPDITVKSLDIYILPSVTAFSIEAFAIQYYAFNNKIYEYDMSIIFDKAIKKDLKELSEDLLLNKQFEQLIIQNAHILRSEVHTQFVTEAPRFVTQE